VVVRGGGVLPVVPEEPATEDVVAIDERGEQNQPNCSGSDVRSSADLSSPRPIHPRPHLPGPTQG
jgi:hypothetical protein